MPHTIATLATMAALAFTLASLRHDLRAWREGRANIKRKLASLGHREARWTITERAKP